MLASGFTNNPGFTNRPSFNSLFLPPGYNLNLLRTSGWFAPTGDLVNIPTHFQPYHVFVVAPRPDEYVSQMIFGLSYRMTRPTLADQDEIIEDGEIMKDKDGNIVYTNRRIAVDTFSDGSIDTELDVNILAVYIRGTVCNVLRFVIDNIPTNENFIDMSIDQNGDVVYNNSRILIDLENHPTISTILNNIVINIDGQIYDDIYYTLYMHPTSDVSVDITVDENGNVVYGNKRLAIDDHSDGTIDTDTNVMNVSVGDQHYDLQFTVDKTTENLNPLAERIITIDKNGNIAYSNKRIATDIDSNGTIDTDTNTMVINTENDSYSNLQFSIDKQQEKEYIEPDISVDDKKQLNYSNKRAAADIDNNGTIDTDNDALTISTDNNTYSELKFTIDKDDITKPKYTEISIGNNGNIRYDNTHVATDLDNNGKVDTDTNTMTISDGKINYSELQFEIDKEPTNENPLTNQNITINSQGNIAYSNKRIATDIDNNGTIDTDTNAMVINDGNVNYENLQFTIDKEPTNENPLTNRNITIDSQGNTVYAPKNLSTDINNDNKADFSLDNMNILTDNGNYDNIQFTINKEPVNENPLVNRSVTVDNQGQVNYTNQRAALDINNDGKVDLDTMSINDGNVNYENLQFTIDKESTNENPSTNQNITIDQNGQINYHTQILTSDQANNTAGAISITIDNDKYDAIKFVLDSSPLVKPNSVHGNDINDIDDELKFTIKQIRVLDELDNAYNKNAQKIDSIIAYLVKGLENEKHTLIIKNNLTKYKNIFKDTIIKVHANENNESIIHANANENNELITNTDNFIIDEPEITVINRSAIYIRTYTCGSWSNWTSLNLSVNETNQIINTPAVYNANEDIYTNFEQLYQYIDSKLALQSNIANVDLSGMQVEVIGYYNEAPYTPNYDVYSVQASGIEYDSSNDFPKTGDPQQLYIAATESRIYRWDEATKTYF